jgi:hypothetical protein
MKQWLERAGCNACWAASLLVLALVSSLSAAQAQETRITKADSHIDGLDPGIRLFVREKMREGNMNFADDNVVLFLHGATAP